MLCGYDNPYVDGHSNRYICTQSCIKQLKLPTGESVSLRASADGMRIKADTTRHGVQIKNAKVNLSNLLVMGYPCYATFAGESNKVIVLLY